MITEHFMKLDPTLKLEEEPLGFHHFNTGGVESEVGEFFYSLARVQHAKRILETGTHHGVSAMYWAKALKDNGGGKLTTLEFDPANVAIAWAQLGRVGLADQVEIIQGDARKFNASGVYDIFLSDSEPNLRFDEVLRYQEFVKPGGYILVHDLDRNMSQVAHEKLEFGWPYGPLPSELNALVSNDILRPIHFMTYRGLMAFYKTEVRDHKWK